MWTEEAGEVGELGLRSRQAVSCRALYGKGRSLGFVEGLLDIHLRLLSRGVI